jgi:hypothetical protein
MEMNEGFFGYVDGETNVHDKIVESRLHAYEWLKGGNG